MKDLVLNANSSNELTVTVSILYIRMCVYVKCTNRRICKTLTFCWAKMEKCVLDAKSKSCLQADINERLIMAHGIVGIVILDVAHNFHFIPIAITRNELTLEELQQCVTPPRKPTTPPRRTT